MKNVTITLDEETVRWIRVEAAEKNTSVSRLIGEILKERMLGDRGYEAAMEKYLERKPRRLKSGERLPSREEIHDRSRLR